MMNSLKSLWLTGLLALSILPWTNIDQATANSIVPAHLIRGIAIPRNALISNPTYRLELRVAENSAIEKLFIDLPTGLEVRSGISIEDISSSKTSPRKLESQFTITDNQVAITFSQPVQANTLVRVNLQGVQPPMQRGNVWLFPISVKAMGTDFIQPLGLLRIATRTPA